MGFLTEFWNCQPSENHFVCRLYHHTIMGGVGWSGGDIFVLILNKEIKIENFLNFWIFFDKIEWILYNA